ncbi:MAG: lytic transglycosylase domain-containing protein [Pseudomonadota bacterium]
MKTTRDSIVRSLVMRGLLNNKRPVLAALIVATTMLFSLGFMGSRADELREIGQLRFFIADVVKTHHMNKLSNGQLTTIAREIKKSSDKYKLDPILVVAVIMAESSFDTDAVSPVGAKGLMQLMPSTAEYISKKIGMRYSGDYTLYNIRANIMIGTYYLSQLSSRYKNNPKLYLAAYNCGPQQVDQFLRESNHVPPIYYARILKMYQKLSS